MSQANIENVHITIMSRTFNLKSPKEKAETLKKSAQYLNRKMQEISRQTGIKDFEGLAVAAALNVIAESDEKIRNNAKSVDNSTLSGEIAEWNRRICELLASAQ